MSKDGAGTAFWAEDDHGEEVKETPLQGFEDFELHAVDDAHLRRWAARHVYPEKVQTQAADRDDVHKAGGMHNLNGSVVPKRNWKRWIVIKVSKVMTDMKMRKLPTT